MVQLSSSAPRRTYISRIILGFLVLLILVGVVSGGAYLYLRYSSPSRWSDPVQQLQKDKIAPSLALLTLTGVNDLEVVNRALMEEKLETAYATILFGTELANGERVGSLLLLGQAYTAAGGNGRAQLCYQQANLITTLSPTLSDFAKASAYLEIGEGLAQLGNRGEALFNYDQAHIVTLHSLYMRDPHRADVLGKLATAYEVLGEGTRASECSAQQAEIRYVFDEPEEASESPPEQPMSPFTMDIPEPTAAMVASYEQRRVEVLQELIGFLEGASQGEAIPEDLMTDVTQALLNEDEARQGVYEQQLAGASSMVLKIGVAEAWVDWLVVKYRTALGGYGLQLVPAWTDHSADIEAELNAAYLELRNTYDEQISTFSDNTAIDRAWFHVFRFEIEQGRLGLYPDYPEEELLSQLTEASERLIASGDSSLYVEVVYEGDTPLFSFAATE